MEHTHSNRLVQETSPYLLQHAHNPVDWFPWGDEALNIAKQTGRPILVSIGYAACHWCHVMERESFEDPGTAAFMNEHFVNIKIDREERPDLDMIYMDAVQAMTGSGGWPLNVFLNTEAKPFYGGTYFPPARAHNRSSWGEVLHFIHDAWTNRREEIEKQAAELAGHMARGEKLFIKNITHPTENDQPVFSKECCDDIAKKLLKNADEEDGGFGAAPKFPQFFSIQFLMQYGHFFKHEKALEHALFSLKKMLKGGIYDQLAGGLSRYSTVSNWLVPHFEKMLYDNALLVMTLSDAYQLTGDPFFSDAIRKTIDFFIHEMKNEEGGFYAALDADSEGEEGKFYVWDKREVDVLMAVDADLFCKWYGISEHGNWEGKNILHISQNEDEFASANGITVTELRNLLNRGNAILLKQRNLRQRPLTDDKIILGWNALFLAALCKAASALGDRRYRDEAVELFEFIRKKFCVEDMIRFHVYKNGISKHPAFLDDYAYLVKASILLQELTGERNYLLFARKLTEYVIDHFENRETGSFYFTHDQQTDIITRKAEFYDGALPSANSVMTENLYYLSAVFDTGEWQTKADQILFNIKEVAIKYPASFSVWSMLMLHRVTGVNEIIIAGKNGQEIHEGIMKLFIPNKLLMAAPEQVPGFPLLEGKNYSHIPLVYLCKNNSCQAPVESIKSLTLLLKNNHY